jgi:hypothetical protein
MDRTLAADHDNEFAALNPARRDGVVSASSLPPDIGALSDAILNNPIKSNISSLKRFPKTHFGITWVTTPRKDPTAAARSFTADRYIILGPIYVPIATDARTPQSGGRVRWQSENAPATTWRTPAGIFKVISPWCAAPGR